MSNFKRLLLIYSLLKCPVKNKLRVCPCFYSFAEDDTRQSISNLNKHSLFKLLIEISLRVCLTIVVLVTCVY